MAYVLTGYDENGDPTYKEVADGPASTPEPTPEPDTSSKWTHNPDSSVTETRPDGVIITQMPDGSTVTQNPGGSTIHTDKDGKSTNIGDNLNGLGKQPVPYDSTKSPVDPNTGLPVTPAAPAIPVPPGATKAPVVPKAPGGSPVVPPGDFDWGKFLPLLLGGGSLLGGLNQTPYKPKTPAELLAMQPSNTPKWSADQTAAMQAPWATGANMKLNAAADQPSSIVARQGKAYLPSHNFDDPMIQPQAAAVTPPSFTPPAQPPGAFQQLQPQQPQPQPQPQQPAQNLGKSGPNYATTATGGSFQLAPAQMQTDFTNSITGMQNGQTIDWAGGKLEKMADGRAYYASPTGSTYLDPRSMQGTADSTFQSLATNNPGIRNQWKNQYGYDYVDPATGSRGGQGRMAELPVYGGDMASDQAGFADPANKQMIDYVRGLQNPQAAQPGAAPRPQSNGQPTTPGYAQGGEVQGALSMLAQGDDQAFSGAVQGNDPGQSDLIDAKLSAGEYVLDAETVSMLGDGNTAAGVAKLDELRQKLRQQKRAAPDGEIPDTVQGPLSQLLGGQANG